MMSWRSSQEILILYHMNFRANWISLEVVVVEFRIPTELETVPFGAKISVLPGVGGGAKFALLKRLNISARN